MWTRLESQTCYFHPFSNPNFGFSGSHSPWKYSPYNRHYVYLTKCFSVFLRLQFGGVNSSTCNSTWLSEWKWWEQSLSQLSVENQGEIQWEFLCLLVHLHVVASITHPKDIWIKRRSRRSPLIQAYAELQDPSRCVNKNLKWIWICAYRHLADADGTGVLPLK